MSTTTTYTCDRCGKNVASKGQLRYFTAELDVGPFNAEVCQPCGGVLMAAVQSTMENGHAR